MTFSIAAKCDRTGQYGVCVATYSMAVGSFVPLIVPGRGLIVFQACVNTNQRAAGTRLISEASSAAGILQDLVAKDDLSEWRQTCAVDAYGQAAGYTGGKTRGWAGHKTGPGYVASGNVLVGPQVVDALAEAFSGSTEKDLAERLMVALEAGRNAGGQPEGLTSAAMLVTDHTPFPIVDLRVDLNDEPVGELRRTWDFYRPMIPYYTARRNGDPTSGFAALPWWKFRAQAVSGWVPRHLRT